MRELKGILVPMVTCFDKNGTLNESGIRQFTNFLIENGVDGLIPTASNGEGSHLSDEELKKVWELVIDEANDRVPVAPCTTSNSTAYTTELSKYAEDLGASAVMIAPPFYFGVNLTTIELLGHYEAVAEGINIPIILYNEPRIMGADLKPDLVAKLAEMENISYIKESTNDARRVHQIISVAEENITVFAGGCDIALEAFALGAKGWITGIHNFIPNKAVEFYKLCVEQEAFEAGRIMYYEDILPFCRWISSTHKVVQAVKEAVNIIGLDAGPPRAPFTRITEKQKDQLRILLGKLGVSI